MHERAAESSPRVYRSTLQAIAATVVVVVVGAFLAAMVVTGPSVGAGALAVVYGVPVVWCAWRWGWGGVFVDENGVRVRGLFRDRRIPWREIKRFVNPASGAASLELVDGRSVTIWAFQVSRRDARRGRTDPEVTAFVDELNALVDAHQPAAFSSS
jgi:hypothetical protein